MIQKYAAGLISVALIAFGYLSQVGDGSFGGPATVQLSALVVAAVGTYIFPLLDTKWQAVGKVLFPVLAALFNAVYPFVVQGSITGQQFSLVVLAVLQALGTQIGADIRLDSKRLHTTGV